MNTVIVGKRLLELLSKDRGAPVDAHTFFEEEFWPVFFNSPDQKHLLQVHNSAFFQNSYVKDAQEAGIPLPEYRKSKFHESLRDTALGKNPPSGNIGVGFMASSPDKGTYGQVTGLPQAFSEEELLCSWFGAGVGIGFGGGFDFLTTHDEVLRFLVAGWPYYRRLIEETPGLKGRQIDAWNGLWVCYGLPHRNDLETAFDRVIEKLESHTSKSGDTLELGRPEWSDQVFAMARAMGGEEMLPMQGYSFGKTNKTLGFMAVQLPKVRHFYELFDHFLQQEKGLESKQLENVFKAHFSMKNAAQYGELGLRALTPKDLPKHLGEDAPDLNKLFKKDPYQFLIYKSWIIAMLDNATLHDLAKRLATALRHYEARDDTSFSTRNDRGKNIETLFEKHHKARFIDGLTNIVRDHENPDTAFDEASTAVATQMTLEEFQLFRSLARFTYSYQLAQETQTA